MTNTVVLPNLATFSNRTEGLRIQAKFKRIEKNSNEFNQIIIEQNFNRNICTLAEFLGLKSDLKSHFTVENLSL